MDSAQNALVDRIRAAAAGRERLRIRAGGSKDFYGNTPRGGILDPSSVRGIVAYDPGELVLVSRCGTPLAEVESMLDESDQMLAFEPPHFGANATIGGCVATGLAGPRRVSSGYTNGPVRDFVLGAKCIDGRGQQLSFGGTVMKNVAGYDTSRLLTGSLGILGVITEVSLKVVPKPRAQATLSFDCDETTALTRMNRWYAEPLPISASAWLGQKLYVRLSGAEAAITGARRALGGDSIDPSTAESFWLGLRNHTNAFFGGAEPLWRLSLPSNCGPLDLSADPLIEWGGSLRWIRSTRDPTLIRAVAYGCGGHAILFRGGDRMHGVFAPLTPALGQIHQRLCDEFDPHRIFDRGRLLLEA